MIRREEAEIKKMLLSQKIQEKREMLNDLQRKKEQECQERSRRLDAERLEKE